MRDVCWLSCGQDGVDMSFGVAYETRRVCVSQYAQRGPDQHCGHLCVCVCVCSSCAACSVIHSVGAGPHDWEQVALWCTSPPPTHTHKKTNHTHTHLRLNPENTQHLQRCWSTNAYTQMHHTHTHRLLLLYTLTDRMCPFKNMTVVDTSWSLNVTSSNVLLLITLHMQPISPSSSSVTYTWPLTYTHKDTGHHRVQGFMKNLLTFLLTVLLFNVPA